MLIHILDDDDAVRTAMLFVLETVGFQVTSYIDAADFLTQEPRAPGILICDVRMPDMTGIELTRLLKRRGSTIPVILITGHVSHALQREAMKAGAELVLEKPVALDALLAAISHVTAAHA